MSSDTWREPREEGGGAEWMEHREEEKVALESIYETGFQEKIAGQVVVQVKRSKGFLYNRAIWFRAF